MYSIVLGASLRVSGRSTCLGSPGSAVSSVVHYLCGSRTILPTIPVFLFVIYRIHMHVSLTKLSVI
jgi:hypothetical protein